RSRAPARAGDRVLECLGRRPPARLRRAARTRSRPRRGEVDAHRAGGAPARRGGGAARHGRRRGPPPRLPAAEPGDRQPAGVRARAGPVRALRLHALRPVRRLPPRSLQHLHDPRARRRARMRRGNTMKQPRLVVVGNGMAGICTLEELLKLAPGMYDITVFGAEPYPNYNRILLSPVLAGEQDFDDIVLNPLSWYADNGITLHLGKQVTRIDRARRRVLAADGTEAAYDRLLLATGSLPFILPIPGKDLKGVIGYRDIDDTRTMIEAAKVKRRAVVIGGGLLGLEAANGLMLRGMEVTVVHLARSGTEAAYDRLLLATGSLPFILPIPGKDLKGVIGYRDIDDTRTMIEAAKVKRRAVVIGGGLLGLEAANGLMLRGMEVTVVHLA